MKNRILLTSVLSALLYSCSCSPVEALSRIEYSSSSESTVSTTPPSGDSFSSEDSTASISSSSSEEIKLSDLTEADYITIPERVVNKLTSYSSYKAITSGNTVSSMFGLNIDQSIDVDCIKGPSLSYLCNRSHSDLVDTYHQCYFKDSKALYRDSRDGEFTQKSLNEYLDIYGVYPFEHALEGYDIRGNNVLGVTKVESNRFKISLNTETSATNVRIQMKTFGGLDDYPTFSRIDIEVTLLEDFTLTSLSMDSQYKAKKMLETDCHQQYTVTYSNYNEAIEIPDSQNADKF